MARIRTLATGIVAWIALASTVSAAPVSWFESQAALTAWYANQLNSAGSVYSSSAAISNFPVHWFTPAPATPVPLQAIPAAPAPVAPAQFAVAPIALSAAPSAPASPGNQADAFINLGGEPYAESSIMTGDPKPWYTSPAAAAVYGGEPSESQRADFAQDVLSQVERTFTLSGIDLDLTTDPNVPAPHMMSVVSGAHYGPNPDAIGITQVGDSGFSFIDNFKYASDPDQLATAVAQNVAHELMHALGVASHPDETGDHVDSAVADWNLLTDRDATFSPSAVAMIKSAMASGADSQGLGAEILKQGVAFHLVCDGSCGLHAEQGVDGAPLLATPVPEPATVAVWMVGLLGGIAIRRGRRAA